MVEKVSVAPLEVEKVSVSRLQVEKVSSEVESGMMKVSVSRL